MGVSGLFSAREVIELFSEADCVIAVGARLSTHTVSGGYLYPNARYIHIDIAPHVLMGSDRGADCYVQGDATATLKELVEALLAKDGVGGQGFHTVGSAPDSASRRQGPRRIRDRAGHGGSARGGATAG